ncbi:nuclear transcription factor Y subunit gamma [Euwallacea fornicatus]|uniref:nuclear transcription factor Y subunit gamma n=1 Tax=Euwallacea fornicatus TaxID=995702 RepID=UPI00338E8087
MPSKKKKYNARFPAGRIKKIMQTDEEVGKVAQAVPVIISKALEMFIESLLKKSSEITQNRNAKTLTPSHMKQCILSESRFDFLKDLVKNIPDASIQEDNENNALAESNVDFGIIPDDPGTPIEPPPPPKERRKDQVPTFHCEQSSSKASSTSRTPVIQFGPNVSRPESSKFNFSVDNLLANKDSHQEQSKLHVTIASQELSRSQPDSNPVTRSHSISKTGSSSFEVMPSLVPLSANMYGHSSSSSTGDNLCIDEDYDN